ncbi:hypothetical protein KC340_g16525 [Hortaea werneckii]|nr:hypothetical protein KC342_g16827 [Hortaea werneckii]KAI7108769.1 hypothetical protein KC339_g1261 [Hortaea werneckii]KAI7210161.1 hypothetical protein KC365_g15398 [Hortaea werneckii]KAI7293241.1 hypothetical protein KC340_g16525 [Hortaea werneckii]
MTLDYKRFRTAQLVRFAHNRNLNVEACPRQKRRCSLRALVDADNDATFRFFDLPAEMRNSCYPEILATCKQVNREAREYLTVGNHSVVDMRLIPFFPGGQTAEWKFMAKATVNGHAPYDDPIGPHVLEYRWWDSSPFMWPRVLLDSELVDVSFAIEGNSGIRDLDCPITASVLLNQAIYELRCVLLEASRTPNVRITICISTHQVLEHEIHRLLSPFALFDCPKQLEFHDTTPEVRWAVADAVATTIESQDLKRVNQLNRWYALRREIAELDRLRCKIGCGLLCAHDKYTRVLKIFKSNNGHMTVDKESALRTALDDLEAYLDQSDDVLNDRRLSAYLAREEQSKAQRRAGGTIHSDSSFSKRNMELVEHN